MKIVRALMFLLPLIVLISGCGDEDVITNITEEGGQNNVDGRVIGTIHGIVTDVVNNARMPGVVVTAVRDGNIITSTTASDGYYTFSDLMSGFYTLTFQYDSTKDLAEDYAVVIVGSVKIPFLTDLFDDCDTPQPPHSRDIPWSETWDQMMYPMTAGVKGRVYREVDDENVLPTADVTVVADFESHGPVKVILRPSLSVNEFTTTTNANGYYTFEKLPAAWEVLLRTLPFSADGLNFRQDATFVELVPDAEVLAENMTAQINDDMAPVIIENNFAEDSFPIDDSLWMLFSEPMVGDSFDIELRRGGVHIPFEHSWNTAETELTISPRVALRAGSNYWLDLEGRAQSLVDFDQGFNFSTIDGITFVISNLERADDLFDNFPLGVPIRATFSLPIDLARTNVELKRGGPGGSLIATTPSLDGVDPKILILTPVSPLLPDTDYWVGGDVASQMVGDQVWWEQQFTTEITVPLPLQVAFREPHPVADYDTRINLPFTWNTVANADFYEIWGRWNSAKETRLLGTYPADAMATHQDETVDLPPDWGSTPFVNNATVSFYVTARNSSGRSPMSTALVIRDTTKPTGIIGWQSDSGDNSTGSDPITITLQFTASEYMAPGHQVILTNAQGTTRVLQWNQLRNGGTISLTIPAGVTIVGETVQLAGLADTSGNDIESDLEHVIFW